MRARMAVAVLAGLASATATAQVRDLRFLGQTPGGSAFNLTYDSAGQRLFVGCGTSIWVYDVAQPENPVRTGMRALRGMINEVVLDRGVLFVAATHAGVWALDASSRTLAALDSFPTPADSAAYDLSLYGDTMYLANGFQVVVLTYASGQGFTEQARFGQQKVMTVCRRDSLIAVGSWGLLNGTVSVYRAGSPTSPAGHWTDATVYNLQDIQFADRRGDIIYLCGGTSNLGVTGHFYALQFAGDTVVPVSHFTVSGIPALAHAQVINMDSRNDTLFVATTAGLYQNASDIPVLDATGLPADTLRVIGHIRPGLWYFDVALLRPRPLLAIASEWYGVWISDVSNLQPLDTIAVVPTGGWCHRSRARGDTLWGCMNGYGLVAWDVDSLLHQAGYVQEFELLQLGREFTVDAAFIDDTLVCLARGAGVGKYALYDLAPWLRGGAPVHLGDFGSLLFAAAECATPVRTPRGTRLAGIAYGGTLEVYDPYGTGHPLLSSLNIGGRSQEIVAAGETLWCGARVDNVQSLCAYRVVQDTPRLAAHVAAPGQVARLVRQGDLFAVACENAGFAWYRLHGDSLEELGRVGSGVVATDVELRGSRLYVADKLGGLKVYDLADPDTAVLVARNPGSAGWQGQFGSYGVDVGADGRIYLSDFNSGVFVIEPAGTGVEEGSGPARAKGGIGAILTRKAALRLAGTAAVYDVDGRRVGPRMVRLGVYFLGHPSRRGKAPPKTKVVVP